MPNWNGLAMLRKIKELNPQIYIVVMTAYGSIEDAVEIMKAGANDYLSKPVDLDPLLQLKKRYTICSSQCGCNYQNNNGK